MKLSEQLEHEGLTLEERLYEVEASITDDYREVHKQAIAEWIAQLEAKNAKFKRDFIGVHQLSQDVISLAEEIRKNCPQGKMIKRWVLEARARGFSKRMLCERREAEALADTQESE